MNEHFQLGTLDDGASGSRPATIGNRVFEALRLAIVQLQLRPGNILSEAEVAKQLGVSRQPVREAFIKLAEIGLVEVKPQRGTLVKLISRREVENARFIREAIEVAVVRRACAEAGDADIAVMRDVVARQKLVSVTGDLAGFLRLDEALHQSIARSVDCEPAWRLLENLKAQMDRVRYLSLPHETPIDTLIAQHDAIVEAIAERDADRAEARMREHLSEILKSLPRIAAIQSEMFSE
ncbi:MAG: GntR family transcriptional regulator [Alphaproteobacteria bacterium]|nr:GntR family transcriptional regulator [Alphaproteobacteria bacterium]